MSGAREPDAKATPASKSPDPTVETIAALAALTQEEREILLKVAEILERLRYGTVLLVVQDGKVVQIEMAEKFRLR